MKKKIVFGIMLVSMSLQVLSSQENSLVATTMFIAAFVMHQHSSAIGKFVISNFPIMNVAKNNTMMSVDSADDIKPTVLFGEAFRNELSNVLQNQNRGSAFSPVTPPIDSKVIDVQGSPNDDAKKVPLQKSLKILHPNSINSEGKYESPEGSPLVFGYESPEGSPLVFRLEKSYVFPNSHNNKFK